MKLPSTHRNHPIKLGTASTHFMVKEEKLSTYLSFYKEISAVLFHHHLFDLVSLSSYLI